MVEIRKCDYRTDHFTHRGFEVGAKNWSISHVQHWLYNFGPFAKVLAVDGQTWHSLQSDIRPAWSESLRSQHQAIPGRVCRPPGNISLNWTASNFFWWFSALWRRGLHVLNQLINIWINETTKVETPRSKVSTVGLHSKSIIWSYCFKPNRTLTPIWRVHVLFVSKRSAEK